MSLIGKINQNSPALSRAIKQVAKSGAVNKRGAVVGTQKIQGYVCYVHDDKSDELFGTVDVQEYDEDYDDAENGAGFHEGVLVSPISKGSDGYLIMPEMYSDVIIVQDPVTHEEYVITCSHANKIKLKSQGNVEIGVVELGEYIDEESLDDVQKTGKSALTTYQKDCIESNVTDGSSSGVVRLTKELIESKVGNDSSSNSMTLNGDSFEVNVGENSISVSGNSIELGGSTDNVVLFSKLDSFLDQLLTILASTTAGGNPLSSAAQFTAMKIQIKTIKSLLVKIKG